MSGKQKCLFITAIKDNRVERGAVIGQLTAQGIDVDFHEWDSVDAFLNKFAGVGGYDLLYLSAHADANGFGDIPYVNPWDKFAEVICAADCMLPEATLFLACCRGGMKTVALNMLAVCNKIDYIVGPVWKAKGGDIANAFRAFCDCCYSKKDGTKEAPCCIQEDLTKAAGQAFACYDRVDMECDLEMFRRLRSVDTQAFENFMRLIDIQRQNSAILKKLEALSQQNEKPPKEE